MGRDITEELGEDAGPSYVNQDAYNDVLNLMKAQTMAQTLSAGKPSPEDKERMDRAEEEYLRREVVSGLMPVLGANKQILLDTARDVVGFIKNG